MIQLAKFRLVVALLLLGGCSATPLMPRQGFLDNFGGSKVFNDVELSCLEKYPRLKSVVATEDPDRFWMSLEPLISEAFECFSVRWAGALVNSESAVGKCRQAVLIREWGKDVAKGRTYYQESAERGAALWKAECGRLISGVTTTRG